MVKFDEHAGITYEIDNLKAEIQRLNAEVERLRAIVDGQYVSQPPELEVLPTGNRPGAL